ncbi:hypothetical protein [Hymenobacter tenuis]
MLSLMITKKIGRKAYHFTVQASDFHELITEADRLSFEDVAQCGLCGSDSLELSARVAKDKYKYVSVKCRGCKADVTFGKRQDDDKQVFLRKKEGGHPGELDWKLYQPEA